MHIQGGINILWTMLILVLGFSVPSFGQITFERTYGDTTSDYGYSVQQTENAGYIVAGYTNSFGAGNYDVYVIKTDSLGDTLWTRTYGDTADDVGYSLQQTSDGGYIIVGHTKSFGAGLEDVYVIKTDSLGDTLWTRTYGGTSHDFGFSVQQTHDGGYVIAGFTDCFGAGWEDVYLIKTDSLGDTLWTRTYGDTSEDVGYSVQQVSDGGYIIGGYTYTFGTSPSDVYLIRTDSLGDTLWTRTYGGADRDEGYCLQQNSDGGYTIAGWTYSFGVAGCDVYLVKTDSLGDTLWTRTYGDTADDVGWSLQQTSDEGYVITGLTSSFGAGSWDVYLIRTDSLGDTLWTRTYGGSNRDEGHSVGQTSDGGYVIAGETHSFGAGLADVYLMKTDEDGLVVGVEERQNGKVKLLNARLYQNQPNPFSRLSVISYHLPVSCHSTLKIYDLSGRLVETLVSENQEPGAYQVQWDGKDQASGIYFYRLTVGRLEASTESLDRDLGAERLSRMSESSPYTATKKMILLR